jgi:hypothetical protein
MNSQKFDSFPDFYVFYLSQHTTPMCKRLHIVGPFVSLIALGIIIDTKCWVYLPVTVIIWYGFAWIGHFFFEKNKPATFSHPFLSFLSDFTMIKDIMYGKVKL